MIIIPSLLPYVLVISLPLVDDAESGLSFLAAYSLTMISILTYLEAAAALIALRSVPLSPLYLTSIKLRIVIIALMYVMPWLVQFPFFPTNMRFNKLFGLTFHNSNPVSFTINITIFMPFTHQVLLPRALIVMFIPVSKRRPCYC